MLLHFHHLLAKHWSLLQTAFPVKVARSAVHLRPRLDGMEKHQVEKMEFDGDDDNLFGSSVLHEGSMSDPQF